MVHKSQLLTVLTPPLRSYLQLLLTHLLGPLISQRNNVKAGEEDLGRRTVPALRPSGIRQRGRGAVEGREVARLQGLGESPAHPPVPRDPVPRLGVCAVGNNATIG